MTQSICHSQSKDINFKNNDESVKNLHRLSRRRQRPIDCRGVVNSKCRWQPKKMSPIPNSHLRPLFDDPETTRYLICYMFVQLLPIKDNNCATFCVNKQHLFDLLKFITFLLIHGSIYLFALCTLKGHTFLYEKAEVYSFNFIFMYY
ncbi:hypothetical protein BLOT_002769 [Blomia tropicalis]|nr:hypothetical protein BLOT_002769 [Blomia tropicalis]